jgi:hypothetical protein
MIFIVFLIYFTSLTIAQETSEVQLNLDILMNIANRNRMNIESMMTIQGTADVEACSYENETLVSKQRKKIIFAVNLKHNYIVSKSSQYENWKIEETGKKDFRCNIDGFLFKDDVAYWYHAANPDIKHPDVNPLFHPSVIGNIIVNQRNIVQNHYSKWSECFNPLHNIVPYASPMPFEQMSAYATIFTNYPPPLPYSASRSGDLLTIKYKNDRRKPPLVNQYVFDVSKSYYLIAFQSSVGNRYGKNWKCELAKINEVWFPSVVENASAGGSDTIKIAFSEVKINKEIPENFFTLQFLGVRQKDHIFDARTQTTSEIDDPAFPLPEYLKQLERKSSTLNWIFIGTGLFLIFCALYRLFSQWRNKKILENTKV